MDLIIADANIFVYLFKCSVLDNLIYSKHYRIKISTAVFNELTAGNRIPKEYPTLRKIFLDIAHNHTTKTNIEIIDINVSLHNISAIEIFYILSETGELDLGEIESIPLATELNGKFITNDFDAITIANKIQSSLACPFKDFCVDLFAKQIINSTELEAINNLL